MQVMVLRDIEKIRTLTSKTRYRIMELTREKPMTATQLAKKLSITVPSVLKHLKELCKAGLIRVSGERRKGHLIEKYYSPAASFVVVDFGVGDPFRAPLPPESWQRRTIGKALGELKRFGYNIPEEEYPELVEKILRYHQALHEISETKYDDIPGEVLHSEYIYARHLAHLVNIYQRGTHKILLECVEEVAKAVLKYSQPEKRETPSREVGNPGKVAT
ncbi:MAG: hypothetical protein DRO11_00475 [Methanobacteriota archaeon]|nr:MAG: hypothetical protein DRO11_00475 [Euryarchaeota archaeon]